MGSNGVALGVGQSLLLGGLVDVSGLVSIVRGGWSLGNWC